MGDYSADKNYNLPQMSNIARTKNFLGLAFCRSDQWSLPEKIRIFSFNSGNNNIKVKFKVDTSKLL